MEFLTALLAFAAVMALLSTIVAVVIEAAINVLGMRSRGLKALLAQYYRDAVAPRLPDGSGLRGDGSEARAFAAAVTSNPARLPGAMRSGARRYNRLTVRQLIEQLARTPAGQAFLSLPDSQLKPHLEALAYEFDRFSEGARDFFTRRTRNTAITIALILAIGLNVDALRLYRVLATDGDTRDRVVALMADVQVVNATLEEAAARRAAGQQPPPPTVLEFGQDPRTSTELTPEQAEQQLRENEQRIDELLTLLANMSIPIGVTQYPYCSRYSPLLGHVADGEAVFDGRCRRIRQIETVLDDPDIVPVAAAERSEDDEGPTAEEIARVRAGIGGLGSLVGEPAARWIVLRSHPDSLLWVFSVLIAGGMIGLGAPFWFNVYRRLGLLIPVVGAAQALTSRSQQTQDGTTVQTTADQGRRDDVNVRGGNNLVVTLRTAAGESPPVDESAADGSAPPPADPGPPPPGMNVGPGSAQRVASATGGEGGAGRGMRRLRG